MTEELKNLAQPVSFYFKKSCQQENASYFKKTYQYTMRPPSILLETVKHTYLLLSGTKTVEDRDGIEDEEAVCVKKLSEV